jgi:F-type H+-transporting ATPase subunit b
MIEVLQAAEFWALIAFLIFVTAAFMPARRALTGALDQRIDGIRRQVEEAKLLREEAQATLANYQRQLRHAAEEASSIIERAREDAERHRAVAEAKLKTVLQAQEMQALEKINQAEAAALRAVREAAVDLAITATGDLLAKRLDGPEGNALVDAAIQELNQKLN